jgi:beta-glucosidase
MYEPASKTWKVAAGDYKVILAADAVQAATAAAPSKVVRLEEATYDVNGKRLP